MRIQLYVTCKECNAVFTLRCIKHVKTHKLWMELIDDFQDRHPIIELYDLL